MKKFLFLLLVFPFHLTAQVNIKKPEIVFDQLIGTWQFGSNAEFETWTKNEHTYFAKVYSVTNGDTTISEEFKIFKSKGKYYLEQSIVLNKISSVSKYQLTGLDEKLMVFENRNLVFPQKIGYEWMPNGLLAVVQEGVVQGKLEFFEFTYVKIQ